MVRLLGSLVQNAHLNTKNVMNFRVSHAPRLYMYILTKACPHCRLVKEIVVRLLVILVEDAFLNTKNVMHFLVAIRVSHSMSMSVVMLSSKH